MNPTPFLARNAGLSTKAEAQRRDALTAEDPLPAVLDIGNDGLVLARRTRVTDVRAETTEDN